MSAGVLPAISPVPVTIVGGYLGAGKTTLVNHLLRHADGVRFAVLVNDFGDLPIDADLIESQDDNVISIAGGCVCCSFGSDLITALFSVRDMEPRPDHLLIEASGVALPGSIAESMSLVADFGLDSVIVMADAETVHERSRQRYFSDTIHRQLVSADLIVLNKSDLVGEENLEATEAWMTSEFPHAACFRTQGAQVPLGLLSDRHVPQSSAGGCLSSKKGHAGHHHKYASGILEFTKGVDPMAVAKQLAAADSNLLRSKGHIEGVDGITYTIQTVGRRSEVRRSPADIKTTGKVVVIAADGHAALSKLADEMGWRFRSG